MRADYILEARAFVRGDFQDVEIGVNTEKGVYTAVKKVLAGEPRLKFPGRVLIPSGVDIHCHFRDPGHPAKEDFASGTRGAALGGIGTVLDMPNTVPVVDRVSRLTEKAERVAPKAVVDWGLWCTFTPDTPKPLDLVNASDGVKLYLAPTTGIPSPGSRQDLRFRLAVAAQAGKVAACHAEQADETPSQDLRHHDQSRSPAGEVATIAEVAQAAPPTARVHIAHASTAEALAAARGASLSAGVTPHHLLLSWDEGALGTRGKCNPPLRSAERRLALWAALQRGDVGIIESDHAPHTFDDKQKEFPEAPAGLPGVETGFPLLLYEAKKRGVEPARVIQAYAENPAARFGLKTGRIEAGFQADFFTLDPRSTVKIRGSELASKCGWTPFESWDSYRVEAHYIRGEVVVEDHRVIAKAGSGRRVASPTEAFHRSHSNPPPWVSK